MHPWHAGQPANALAELELEGGRKLRARLVVGADGGRSRMRQLADLRTIGWGYGQVPLPAPASVSVVSV